MDLHEKLCILLFLALMCFNGAQTATPEFAELPITKTVGQNEDEPRLLYTLTVTDASNHGFTCSMTQVDNTGATVTHFRLASGSGANPWSIHTTVTAANTFDPTLTYTITVTCVDGNGLTGTGVIEVITKAGEKIKSNLLSTTKTMSATTTTSGTFVFNAGATSDLGSTLYYSLDVQPAAFANYFRIDGNGQIEANLDLIGIDATTPSVTIDVNVTDNEISIVDTLILTLTQQNTIPTSDTLPKNETLLETTAAGSTLFAVSTNDIDVGQSHTYEFDCIPVSQQGLFDIDTNGNFKLRTTETLNFEAANDIYCNIYISDGIHKGGPYVYHLTVGDANEQCAFDQPLYSITTQEGSTSAISWTPPFTITDVDAGDTTFTYSLMTVNDSSNFAIDSATGQMTYAVNYDIDSTYSSLVYLTVYAVDEGGPGNVPMTCSSQVKITIEDVNDNNPEFASSSFTLTASQLTDPGTVLSSLAVTDRDSGQNAVTSCSAAQTSGLAGYVDVAANCDVYVTGSLADLTDGTMLTYLVTAVDAGSPQRTGTTTLNFVYNEQTTTTTTTTSTTTAYNFWAHAENVVLFVIALLAALALLGLLLYCCLRFCCGGCGGGMFDCFSGGGRSSSDCCARRRYPPRQVTPESPPPRKKSPLPERERTPVVVRTQPRIVERQPRLVRTLVAPQPMAPPPAYTSWRFPPGGQFVRSAAPYPGPLLP